MITNYETMLISALRYALGRRTYIVSTTAEYIVRQCEAGHVPVLCQG